MNPLKWVSGTIEDCYQRFSGRVGPFKYNVVIQCRPDRPDRLEFALEVDHAE